VPECKRIALRTYYAELWNIAIKDVRAFWTAHKLITSLPAPLVGFLISIILSKGVHSWMDFLQAVEVSLLSGAAGFTLTMIVSLVKAPKLLDDKRRCEITTRDEANQQIREAFATESSDFKKQIDGMQAVTEMRDKKPKRTAAEEQKYAEAKTALSKFGDAGIVALRHLEKHGTLTFTALADPSIPIGMNARDLQAILAACAIDSLVTRETIHKSGGIDYVYKIAPGMKAALDELLYLPAMG